MYEKNRGEKERVPTKHLLWNEEMEEKRKRMVKEKGKKWKRIRVLLRRWYQ